MVNVTDPSQRDGWSTPLAQSGIKYFCVQNLEMRAARAAAAPPPQLVTGGGGGDARLLRQLRGRVQGSRQPGAAERDRTRGPADKAKGAKKVAKKKAPKTVHLKSTLTLANKNYPKPAHEVRKCA